jgi:hypothetical protein
VVLRYSIRSLKERKERHSVNICLVISGMGKEVENLIMENNELLATK